MDLPETLDLGSPPPPYSDSDDESEEPNLPYPMLPPPGSKPGDYGLKSREENLPKWYQEIVQQQENKSNSSLPAV